MKLDSNTISVSGKELAGLVKTTCEKGFPFKFKARGGSMSPFICNGDSVVVEPLPPYEQFNVGDVVACKVPENGRLIIHRIIDKKNTKFLIKGDNVFDADGFFDKKDIYGIIKIIVPQKTGSFFHRKSRQVGLSLGRMNKPIAFLSRYKILLPMCRIANKFLSLC